MAFIPVADPSTAPSPRKMLGNWRRSERIDRQFTKNPPEIAPEDRDEVIAGSKGLLATSVVAVDRSIWVPCGYVLVWLALVVAGLASAEHLNILLLPLIFAALQSATVLTSVVAAGRAATAHYRALALPPAPVDSSPIEPKSRPTGSMLALPDESRLTQKPCPLNGSLSGVQLSAPEFMEHPRELAVAPPGVDRCPNEGGEEEHGEDQPNWIGCRSKPEAERNERHEHDR